MAIDSIIIQVLCRMFVVCRATIALSQFQFLCRTKWNALLFGSVNCRPLRNALPFNVSFLFLLLIFSCMGLFRVWSAFFCYWAELLEIFAPFMGTIDRNYLQSHIHAYQEPYRMSIVICYILFHIHTHT